MLINLPVVDLYHTCHNHQSTEGDYMRATFELSRTRLPELPTDQDLWRGIASVLAAPELKQAVYRRLAKDLAFRFGVAASKVEQIPGFAKPTLYRETTGFEIAPHTDTRKKIVAMHLYLPADCSQLDLGTSLYRRKLLAWPFGSWQERFAEFKRFLFRPNSGYAFVVNNAWTRKAGMAARSYHPMQACETHSIPPSTYRRGKDLATTWSRSCERGSVACSETLLVLF